MIPGFLFSIPVVYEGYMYTYNCSSVFIIYFLKDVPVHTPNEILQLF